MNYLDAAIQGYSVMHPEIADALRLLLSDRVEAKAVRDWIKAHSPTGQVRVPFLPIGYTGKDRLLTCEYWELELSNLADVFAVEPRLSNWQKTAKDSRRTHARRVASLARELADEIEQSSGPNYPPILSLLDESAVMLMAMEMPRAFTQITGEIYAATPDPPLDTVAGRFGWLFTDDREPHQIPGVLRKIADFAESAIDEPTPVARFMTGNPAARQFAIKLNEYLLSRYGKHADRINAYCVSLKYPGICPSPTEKSIRKWTGRS